MGNSRKEWQQNESYDSILIWHILKKSNAIAVEIKFAEITIIWYNMTKLFFVIRPRSCLANSILLHSVVSMIYSLFHFLIQPRLPLTDITVEFINTYFIFHENTKNNYWTTIVTKLLSHNSTFFRLKIQYNTLIYYKA